MVSTLENDPLLKGIPLVEGWKVLAPVVLYAKIGQGGMGAVYRGRHLDFDIDVAVKCLKPSLAAEDEQFVARFRREARLAASLTHENLVRVYETRKAHGLHYLVMEFVDGETARDRVQRKGPLDEHEAAAIVLGAARGLSKAHRNHDVVVHRDVKPDNILVSRRGEVKLLDLGIAKALEHEDGVATFSTQGVIGTPQYMAPEQWERDQQIGPWTDIWAFGATLFFLLTGENAIRAGTERQIYVDVCQKPFPDVRVKRPEISAAMAGILKKCLHKEADQRYADAGHLADALAAFLGQRAPSLIDQDTGLERTLPLVSPPPMPTIKRIRTHVESATGAATTPPPAATIVVPRSKSKWWWIGGGVAAAGVAAFAGWRLLGGGAGQGNQAGLRVEGEAAGHLYTREDRITVRGFADSANKTPVTATLEGAAERICALDQRGNFQLELPLAKNERRKLSLRQGQAEPFELTLVQDAVPPKIEITEPAGAARTTNRSRLRVRAKVSEADLSSVTLGGVAMKSEADEQWLLDDVALEAEGPNDLYVNATDRAGNTESRRVTVHRDTREPSLLLSKPESDAAFDAGSQVKLTLEFDEELASAKVGKQVVTPAGKSATATIDVPPTQGQFRVLYSVSDAAGNPSQGELIFSSEPKTLARIELDQDVPEGGVHYVPGESLSLTGRIRSPKAADIELTIDGKRSSHDLEGAGKDEIAVRGWLPAKRCRVELRHGDVTRQFEVVQDATPPVLTLLSPKPAELRTRAPRIEVSVALVEDHPKQVLAGKTPLVKQANGNWLAPVELPSADGKLELAIVAEDLAGNRSEPLALALVLDTLAPELASATPPAEKALAPGAKIEFSLVFGETLRAAKIADKPARIADARASLELAAPSSAGPWIVRYKVEDLAGNPREGLVTYQVKVMAPLPAPRIELPELAAAAGGVVCTAGETFELHPRIANAGDGSLTATLDGVALPCTPEDGGYRVAGTLPPDVPCTLVLTYGAKTETVKLCHDTLPPAIEIVSPAADAPPTKQATITVVARVVEANLATLRIGTLDFAKQPDGSWRADGVPLANEGDNELAVEAEDRARRSGSAVVRVRRDTVPAKLLPGSQPENASAVTPGESVAFRLVFDEPLASASAAQVEATVAGAEVSFELTVPAGGGPWNVTGKAYDLAGNETPLAWTLVRPGAAPAPLVALPGFTAVGSEVNELGYPAALRHDATGIELLALDWRPDAKPTLYVSSKLVTEKQYGGKGSDKPKVSVSAESLLGDFFRKRGKELALPTVQDWNRMAASSNPAIRARAGSEDELLQGEATKTSWPTRTAKGKEGSQPRSSSLSVLGFRVVYRVR